MDVSTDGGANWNEARLQEPILSKCLTRFRLSWNWDGAPAVLQSRAIDETGYVQPTRQQLVDVRGLNSYYHYNAIQTWLVADDGTVSNVPSAPALLIGGAIAAVAVAATQAADSSRLGIGRIATKDEIAGWDIDVRADGQGLPEGRGSVQDGDKLYAETCAACHGEKGEANRLIDS